MNPLVLAGTAASSRLKTQPKPAQVQRNGVGFAQTISLPANSTPGNKVLALVRFAATATKATPAGYTELAVVPWSTQQLGLYAKDAAGTTETVTVNADTSLEIQEWSNLAPVASLYDATNSITFSPNESRVLWDPAAVTAGQPNALYLAGLAGQGTLGATVTNWTGSPDGIQNWTLLATCWKSVDNAAPFDTSFQWTTSRTPYAVLAVLRGI